GRAAGVRQVAGDMDVLAAVLADRLADFRRTAVGARETDDIMTGPCESRGDFDAKAFGNAGDEQDRAGHRGQIQRRMLSRKTICAPQPTANASVRATGTPPRYTKKWTSRAKK